MTMCLNLLNILLNLVATSLASSVTFATCFKDDIQTDKYMTRHTYRRLGINSLQVCAAECLMSSACLSFSYQDHICHLHDNTSSADLIDMTDYIYSDIKPWSRSLAGPCNGVNCPNGSRCEVDRLHRANCVPEFPGCGEPPDVGGADKEYDGHFLSAKATYTCQSDFMKCVDDSTSVCQSGGEWEDISGFCKRYRWHDPAYAAQLYVPCQPSNSFQVIIKATPTDSSYSVFKLYRGEDILFHLSFNFNFSENYINVTLIRTRLSGDWNVWNIVPVIPVSAGQQSRVSISLELGVYTVHVDGAYLTNFTEKLSGASVEMLQIWRKIDVSSVEFHLLNR